MKNIQNMLKSGCVSLHALNMFEHVHILFSNYLITRPIHYMKIKIEPSGILSGSAARHFVIYEQDAQQTLSNKSAIIILPSTEAFS